MFSIGTKVFMGFTGVFFTFSIFLTVNTSATTTSAAVEEGKMLTNGVPTMAIVVPTATIANTTVAFVLVACTKAPCVLGDGCSRFPILSIASGLKRFGKLRELRNDTGSNLYGKIRK